MNFKNKVFKIGWAQCISDLVSKMASTKDKMRLSKQFLLYSYLEIIVKCLQEFFWPSFEFLETYEQVCMHFTLNSAPCKPKC